MARKSYYLATGAALMASLLSCKTLRMSTEKSLAASSQDDVTAPAAQEQMTLEKLRTKAFDVCQKPYYKPTIQPVQVLDPPTDGKGRKGVGMTYQEELAIRTRNILDKDQFYITPRIRAALNQQSMNIYVDPDDSGNYRLVKWEDAKPDFTAQEPVLDKSGKPVMGPDGSPIMQPSIVPPVHDSDIPDFARVLTEVKFGHQSPNNTWPQPFDLRSNAYVRFSGYDEVQGASFRLGAHKVWSIINPDAQTQLYTSKSSFTEDGPDLEDFPYVISMYLSIKDQTKANAMLVMQDQLLCGALSLDLLPGAHSAIVVDSYWYLRSDYSWKSDPNTALAAYSSMFWKRDEDTPDITGDAAHDSDTLTIYYPGGKKVDHPISQPPGILRVRDLTDVDGGQAVGWALVNQDYDPDHYSHFAKYLGNSNYDKRDSYMVEILESNVPTGVRLYEHFTTGEYLDNIVAASTLKTDLPRSKSPADFIHFKYRTTSFHASNPPPPPG